MHKMKTIFFSFEVLYVGKYYKMKTKTTGLTHQCHLICFSLTSHKDVDNNSSHKFKLSNALQVLVSTKPVNRCTI